MSRPRKEQVKNLKAKYARGPTSVAFGACSVQSVLGADYTAVLAATRTGVDGGAETSSGAVLTSSQGPYSLAVNSGFNVIMPGVNGGAPMAVSFLAADFVSLNGLSVLTTSRAAARINTVMAGHGVTGPVAVNQDGRLVIRSANSSGLTYGDSASVSLTAITAGILSVFGLSATGLVSAFGVQTPKRGLITSSRDGLGGYVQLRSADSSPTEASNTSMLHAGPYRYVQETLSGSPAHGRVKKVTGGLEFSYWRVGPANPSLVTSQSNFSSLGSSNTLSVSLNFGNGKTVSAFTVSVSAITTVAQIVTALNAAYNAATLSQHSVEMGRAAVPVQYAGPYVFTDPTTRDSFFIAFNGNAPIHVNPPAATYSALGFATYINSRITAAGQTAEGEAVIVSLDGNPSTVVLRSKSTAGTASSVRIMAGNPGGSSPAAYMETLNSLGLSPGLYKGTSIARLYGLDEIELSCPTTLPGASMTVVAVDGTAASRWGIPAGSNVKTVTSGMVRAFVPAVSVLLPEVLEFHEEPDDYDTIIQDFDDRGDASGVDPTVGVGNASVSPLLDQFGKVDPSLIPRILETLSVGRLTLGSGFGKDLAGQSSPRTVFPHDPAIGPVLLWEGAPVGGLTDGVLRMYLHDKDLYVSQNARMTSTTSWSRDAAGNSGLFELHAGRASFASWPAASASSWAHSAWERDVKFNPLTVASGPFNASLVSLGEHKASGGKELIPRFEIPSTIGSPTLLFDARSLPAGAGAHVRGYLCVNGSGSSTYLEILVNASWSGSEYVKDVMGVEATGYRFGASGGFVVSSRHAGNDANWTVWDGNPVSIDPATLAVTFGGQIIPGGGLTDASTSRVRLNRYLPSANRRTLLLESPANGADATIPIRAYIEGKNSGFKIGGGGLGDGFCFTFNARWDQALDKWVQDISSSRSYAWVMTGGAFWFVSMPASTAPWADATTNWESYDSFYRATSSPTGGGGVNLKDGVFRVIGLPEVGSATNPLPGATILPNTLYAKSMVKSWGWISSNSSAPYTQLIMDGFNLTSIVGAGVATNQIEVVFTTPIGGLGGFMSTVAAPVAQGILDYPTKLLVFPSTSSSFFILFVRSDNLAVLNNDASRNNFTYVVCGPQSS